MKNILLIAISLLAFACHHTNEQMYSGKEADLDQIMEIPATQQPAPVQQSETEQVSKKVVKTGGISFQSENIDKDYQKILATLPKYQAYIENENQSKSSQRIDHTLTIRVPSHRYDTLYASLSKVGLRLDNKYSNIEDVTTRYYDLKSRIANKKALEQRYTELLKKASAIKDILEIEKNLNQIRTDIELIQGQFNYLSKQVSLSTINVSCYEILPYAYDSSQRKGFGARLLNALDDGWQGFLSFLIILMNLWPFLLLLTLGIYLLLKFKRKQSGKKSL